MSRARGPWLAVLLAAAAVLAVRLLPVAELLREVQAWVAGRGLLGVLVFVVVYVLAALLLVPGSLLTLGAGLLFGVLGGTAVVSAASTTAAALAFLIARHLARARVAALAARHPRFAAVDEAVRVRGWTVVVLLRLSPLIPFSLSNYLYGLTPVGFLPYVAASWAGMLPGTVLYVWLGAAGGAAAGGARRPQEWALLGVGLLATAAVTVLLAHAARRSLQKAPAPP